MQVQTRAARSGCATGTTKRATASRLSRDAVHALATGRVALAPEKPSQGRRSLSRFPVSGPQGFWPMELNISWGSKQSPSHSFRFQDLRLLADRRGSIWFGVVLATRCHPPCERGVQNVGSEEISSVGWHHDDLQFVRETFGDDFLDQHRILLEHSRFTL